MTRTLFSGASVVDGSGAGPTPADLVVEDGRIVEVGSGLDGDERVDLSGRALLPASSTATRTSWSAASTPCSCSRRRSATGSSRRRETWKPR